MTPDSPNFFTLKCSDFLWHKWLESAQEIKHKESCA